MLNEELQAVLARGDDTAKVVIEAADGERYEVGAARVLDVVVLTLGERAVQDAECPTCRGTGGGMYNDCATCGGNGVV